LGANAGARAFAAIAAAPASYGVIANPRHRKISAIGEHTDNQRFHKLMDKHKNFWVKVTCPERMTVAGPPYDDVVPFGRALVERFPDRVIWGTDWPHPNVKVAPDDGVLVDYVPRIAATAALQQALLVDNPMRLYWS
jgi:2-pyrone-4,6-dicarboxylate lactonase